MRLVWFAFGCLALDAPICAHVPIKVLQTTQLAYRSAFRSYACICLPCRLPGCHVHKPTVPSTVALSSAWADKYSARVCLHTWAPPHSCVVPSWASVAHLATSEYTHVKRYYYYDNSLLHVPLSFCMCAM